MLVGVPSDFDCHTLIKLAGFFVYYCEVLISYTVKYDTNYRITHFSALFKYHESNQKCYTEIRRQLAI